MSFAISSGGSVPCTLGIGISSNSTLSVIFRALSRKASPIFLSLESVTTKTLSFSLKPMHFFRIMLVAFITDILNYKFSFFYYPMLFFIPADAVNIQFLPWAVYDNVCMVLRCPVRLKPGAQSNMDHVCYLLVDNKVIAKLCIRVCVDYKFHDPAEISFLQVYGLLRKAFVLFLIEDVLPCLLLFFLKFFNNVFRA